LDAGQFLDPTRPDPAHIKAEEEEEDASHKYATTLAALIGAVNAFNY